MDSAGHTLPSKRRKVRKGTRNCTECKRRKMKCDMATQSPCSPCAKRGSRCIGQDIIQEDSPPSSRNEDTATSIATPLSVIGESFDRPEGDNDVESSVLASKHHNDAALSRLLYKSLPGSENIRRLCDVARTRYVLAHELLTLPYSVLDGKRLQTPDDLLHIPQSDSHPVVLAKYLLIFATFLQHLSPDDQEESYILAELAIRCVTTKDAILGSVEGLECVMLESVYRANVGNLRQSWLANRRAFNMAQLMGLNRPKEHSHLKVLCSHTQFDPQHMWFRIISMDRHLSLMLGLPQTSLDCCMADDTLLATDTPMGRLERHHSVVMSDILRSNKEHSTSNDFDQVRALDRNMQKAAQELPSRWWLAPNLEAASTDCEAMFWDTRRLFTQIFHHNILSRLHLPYMFRKYDGDGRNYQYSQLTCMNACREIVSRFIALRSYNQIATTCRSIDFIALMAALTLLLAYLIGRSPDRDDILNHQYLGDRAMLEKVQERMTVMNKLNSDPLSAQSVDLLDRLLALDSDRGEAGSDSYTSVCVHGMDSDPSSLHPPSDDAVCIRIPYFGTVRIERGTISRTSVYPRACGSDAAIGSRCAPSCGASNCADLGKLQPYDFREPAAGAASFDGMPKILSNGVFDPSNNAALTNGSSYGSIGTVPGLTAGGDDWAFQGVDTAFFDSLMMGSSDFALGDDTHMI